MSIKRNATAIMKINVRINIDSLRSIEFLFKKEKNPICFDLVRKKYDKSEIEIYNHENNENGFTMLLRLKPKETYRLKPGRVYLDTRIVLTDGTVPSVPIVPIDDVQQTLFNEVYEDEYKY